METSPTASAILKILASIRLTGDETGPEDGNYGHKMIAGHRKYNTAPKSVVIKRRLSNSSDGSNRSGMLSGPNPTTSLEHGTKKEALHRSKRVPKVLRPKTQLCDPLDREQIIYRISTFNILNWTIEDDRLTPLECSVNGWKCHSKNKDVLCCSSCHARIMVRLGGTGRTFMPAYSMSTYANYMNDDIDQDQEEAELRRTIVGSYLSRLHTDHYEGCIWKAVDESVGRRQYYLENSDFEQIQANYDRIVAQDGANEKLILRLKSFQRDILTQDEMNILRAYSGKYNDVILMMATFGWEITQQKFGKQTLVLLKCCDCSRRILLGQIAGELPNVAKLGTCSYPAADLTNDDNTPFSAHEDFENDTGPDVNLKTEHERWCCTVGRFAPEDLPGYKVGLKVIKSLLTEAPDDSMAESEVDYDSSMAELRGL